MSNAALISDLLKKRCSTCAPGTPPASEARVRDVLRELPGWELAGKEIGKTFKFANYHETMAFVNATAWISHREDHHPELRVGYNECRVAYHTHAIKGLSENDFICAAKLDALFDL